MTLRQQAEAIWRSGVAAVDSETLVRQSIQRQDDRIAIYGESFQIDSLHRIVVVGAGKAGAGMAAGVEASLSPQHIQTKLTGWVNVPADCQRPLQKIKLHAARPPGVNEPTSDGVLGSQHILELVSSLTDDDLCLVLISGGGSALLPAPIAGITLEEKRAVTQFLMRSGATIQELNTVRKRLSRIKGGGLLRAAPAGRMIALIISDVPGDPLDIIASGPTVCDNATPEDAIRILERFTKRGTTPTGVPESIWRVLDQQVQSTAARPLPAIGCRNQIIGNNQTAMDAAAIQATALGYEVRSLGTNRQGIVLPHKKRRRERECAFWREESRSSSWPKPINPVAVVEIRNWPWLRGCAGKAKRSPVSLFCPEGQTERMARRMPQVPFMTPRFSSRQGNVNFPWKRSSRSTIRTRFLPKSADY